MQPLSSLYQLDNRLGIFVRTPNRTAVLEPNRLGPPHKWPKKAPDLLRVDVSRDVGHRLVPDVAVLIPPSIPFEYGVNSRPPDLRVPEPKRRLRCRLLRPRRDMWLVPFRHPRVVGRVAVESQNPVSPVRHDHSGHAPPLIMVDAVA